jgi:hypothetical protein
MEAVVTGFVEGHPSVMAMIDQWTRENETDFQDEKPSLRLKELGEVYGAIAAGDGLMTDEEKDNE